MKKVNVSYMYACSVIQADGQHSIVLEYQDIGFSFSGCFQLPDVAITWPSRARGWLMWTGYVDDDDYGLVLLSLSVSIYDVLIDIDITDRAFVLELARFCDLIRGIDVKVTQLQAV